MKARSVYLVLIMLLLAPHGQSMDRMDASAHRHIVAEASSNHSQRHCAVNCCSDATCCVQAIEAMLIIVPEHRSSPFCAVSDAFQAVAAIGPPEPPPRQFAAWT